MTSSAVPEWLLDRLAESATLVRRRVTVEVPAGTGAPEITALVVERQRELAARAGETVTLVDWTLVATGPALRTLLREGVHAIVEAARREATGGTVWTESVTVVPPPTLRTEWAEAGTHTGEFLRRIDDRHEAPRVEFAELAAACRSEPDEVAAVVEGMPPAETESWCPTLVAHAVSLAENGGGR